MIKCCGREYYGDRESALFLKEQRGCTLGCSCAHSRLAAVELYHRLVVDAKLFPLRWAEHTVSKQACRAPSYNPTSFCSYRTEKAQPSMGTLEELRHSNTKEGDAEADTTAGLSRMTTWMAPALPEGTVVLPEAHTMSAVQLERGRSSKGEQVSLLCSEGQGVKQTLQPTH